MNKNVISNPPIKNPITATNDGSCKSLKPEMACPDVQPFAQRVPNPISKPPISRILLPFSVNKFSIEKISSGANVWLATMFIFSSAALVLSDTITASPAFIKVKAIKPPIIVPTIYTNNQASSFQLYLKN